MARVAACIGLDSFGWRLILIGQAWSGSWGGVAVIVEAVVRCGVLLLTFFCVFRAIAFVSSIIRVVRQNV
ncbi:hypothetical protein GCM10025791_17800 [Halioxenophilus aromaticivorans]|uniref:Uncharacterized protein n=1 Tax=Halioxenophilus aromaticivorans TaxID=1306992 RepID=A0AAV3U2L8_9ALTE